jgi:hypothetical protein
MYKQKSISGVSLAIRDTMVAYKNQSTLLERQIPSEFSIKIANTLEERQAAFQLAYLVYLEKGFIKENYSEMLVRNYDNDENTIILIVQDRQKNVVGSATIVFDEKSRLPAENVYIEELKELRKSNQVISEFSRLVISNTHRNSKEIIVLLFNYAAIYITQVKSCDGLVVEVNPRHKNYYKALLSFDELGKEKPCPQVQNMPGVLLYLPIKRYNEIIKQKDTFFSNEKKERSLYPYFLNAEQENLVAFYLRKQTKPMTASEKIYFGFSESNTRMAVAY